MFPETAIVTGARGGIGRALVTLLEAEGAEVRDLDLADGFDVSDPQAWLDIPAADLVCLNAGVLAKGDGTIDDYRRAAALHVPQCPRPARRGRRGHGSATVTVRTGRVGARTRHVPRRHGSLGSAR